MEHSGNQLIPSLELESVTEFIQLIESIEQDMLRQEDSFWKNAPHPFNECTAYQKIKALPADKKVLALRALIYRANTCLLYTSPSPRDRQKSRMPSSA